MTSDIFFLHKLKWDNNELIFVFIEIYNIQSKYITTKYYEIKSIFLYNFLIA